MQMVQRMERKKRDEREEECNSLPKGEMLKEGCVSLVKGMFP